MPSGLSILEVVITIAVSFTGLVIAIGQIVKAIKVRWIEDSRNTEAIKANTDAVKELSRTVSGQAAQISEVCDRLERVEIQLGK